MFTADFFFKYTLNIIIIYDDHILNVRWTFYNIWPRSFSYTLFLKKNTMNIFTKYTLNKNLLYDEHFIHIYEYFFIIHWFFYIYTVNKFWPLHALNDVRGRQNWARGVATTHRNPRQKRPHISQAVCHILASYSHTNNVHL